GLLAVDHQGVVAAEAAFPVGRSLGLGREGDGEAMTPRAVVGDLLARGQVGVAVVLVARSPEPGTAKCSLGHRLHASRRSSGLRGCNVPVRVKIPQATVIQPWDNGRPRGPCAALCTFSFGGGP